MRSKIIPILISFFLFTFCLEAGYWTSLTSGTTEPLRGVYFINDSTGWIVGGTSGEFIRKTTNAGLSWTTQLSLTNVGLISVYFDDPNDGYATGYSGRLLKTTNGGSNWVFLSTCPLYNGIYGVCMDYDGDVYVAGSLTSGRTNAISTNEGSSWTAYYNPAESALLTIRAFSSSIMNNRLLMVSGSGGGLYYRLENDNPNSWNDISYGSGNFYDCLYNRTGMFPNISYHYFGVGENGMIIKKTDGGSWSEEYSGSMTWRGIDQASTNNLFVVGTGGTIVSSMNNGEDWRPYVNSPTSEDLFDVCFPSATCGYAVGENGALIKYIGNAVYANDVNQAYCPGDSIEISYTEAGFFYSDNTFTARLSDASGDFANPIELGTITTQYQGTISAVLPISLPPGSGYKIRIVSSSPAVTGVETASFAINPLPTFNDFSNFDDYACKDQSKNYYEDDYSNPLPLYTWEAEGGSIVGRSDGPGVEVLWGSGSQGVLRLTKENSETGCSGTIEKTISLQDPPYPEIDEIDYGGQTEICAGEEKIYTAVNDWDSQWSVAGGEIVGVETGSEVTIQWYDQSPGTITLTQTDEFGCIGTRDFEIVVNPLPVPDIYEIASPDGYEVCALSEVAYSTDPILGSEWFVTGGAILGSATSDNALIKWGEAGLGKLKLLQTNEFGCTDSIEIEVTINPLPEPEIYEIPAEEYEVCVESEATYSTDPTLDSKWYVVGGSVIGGSTGDEVYVKWTEVGAGELKLIQTGANGCVDSIVVDVIINPLPEPEIYGVMKVCDNCEEVYRSSEGAGYKNEWEAEGGEIIGSKIGEEITIRWGEEGVGTITLTQTNLETNCTASIEINVLIEDYPTPTISGDDEVCLYDEEIYSTTSNTDLEKRWIVSGGEIIDGEFESVVTVRWTKVGDWKLEVTLSDEGTSYEETAEIDVTVNSLPEVSFDCPVEEICVNEPSFELTGGFPEGGEYFGEGVASGKFIPEVAGAGEFDVIYRFSDGICENEALRKIVVWPKPPKPSIKLGGGALESTSAASYQWYKDAVEIPGATKKVYVPTTGGLYTVEITDEHGCKNMSDPFYTDPSGIAREEIPNAKLSVVPNPFGENAVIVLELDKSTGVNISIYEVGGCLIDEIVDERKLEKGSHSFDINSKNLSDGVYYCLVVADDGCLLCRFLVLK